MNDNKLTDEELEKFCLAVDEIIIANYAQTAYMANDETPLQYAERVHGFKPTTFNRKANSKYVAIWRHTNQKLIFCFVDNFNGDIYYAATWRAPEPKRYVRGNIKNGAADVTPYGAKGLDQIKEWRISNAKA